MRADYSLTLMPNPFDLSQVNRRVEQADGRSVAQVVNEALAEWYPRVASGFEWAMLLDGRDVTAEADSLYPTPGCRVAACPVVMNGGGGGGKDMGRTLGMLAVMVAAVATQQYYLGAGYSAFTAAAAGAGVALGGATLVNAVFPAGQADTSATATAGTWGEASNNYGWNVSGNPAMNGGALPVLYGTRRVKPYKISQYVHSDGDKQYLRMLFGVVGHKLSDIRDTRINGSDASSFATIETRLGTPDQAMIEKFGDVIYEKAVGVTIPADGSWTAIISTDGDGLDGLGLALLCPKGLYRLGADNSLKNQTLKVELQYRQVGATGWTSLGVKEITGAQSDALRRIYRQDNLAQAGYQVQARFAEVPPSTIEYATTMQLEYLQEIIYDDLAYPGVALLAVDALATDQLNTSEPEVDCIAVRETVDVWNGESWVEKDASNPAWATWDAHRNPFYGGGADKARFIYSEFEAWADFCDEMGLKVSMYYDQAAALPTAADMLGTVGRGRIMPRGTRIGCQFDGPVTEPAHIFDAGNIVASSFRMEYLPLTDRANMLELTYYDADKDHERTPLTVISDDYNAATDEARVATLTLYACDSKELAYRHGKLLLRRNQYLRREPSWTSPVDAVHVQNGDVVRVQHPLPLWGYGGHVLEADAGSLKMDQLVSLDEEASYRVLVRHMDDTTEEHAVVTAGGVITDTLAISGAWTQTPLRFEHYVFGQEGKLGKLFRIEEAGRSTDLLCSFKALEYRAEVFEEPEDMPEYESESDLVAVAGLGASITQRYLEGLSKYVLCLYWRGYRLRWNVYYRKLGDLSWKLWGSTVVAKVDIYNLEEGALYQFSVTADENPHLGESILVDFPGGTSIGQLARVVDAEGRNYVLADGKTVYYGVVR